MFNDAYDARCFNFTVAKMLRMSLVQDCPVTTMVMAWNYFLGVSRSHLWWKNRPKFAVNRCHDDDDVMRMWKWIVRDFVFRPISNATLHEIFLNLFQCFRVSFMRRTRRCCCSHPVNLLRLLPTSRKCTYPILSLSLCNFYAIWLSITLSAGFKFVQLPLI